MDPNVVRRESNDHNREATHAGLPRDLSARHIGNLLEVAKLRSLCSVVYPAPHSRRLQSKMKS